jgi:hypothetical protein
MSVDSACRVLVAVLVASVPPAGLTAQAVRGRVLDAETGTPVSGVQLVLWSSRDTAARRVISNADGLFYLVGRDDGDHRLEASHIAYETSTTSVQLNAQELVTVTLRLSRAVILLDPLTVTARGHDPRHDATYEGLYARRSEFPRIGPRRVVLHTDLEMMAMRVRDVLRWFEIRPRCRVVYWNGRMVNSLLMADAWIDETSAASLEGLEYYQSSLDAPAAFRDVPGYMLDNYRCSVVVLWPRRPTP